MTDMLIVALANKAERAEAERDTYRKRALVLVRRAREYHQSAYAWQKDLNEAYNVALPYMRAERDEARAALDVLQYEYDGLTEIADRQYASLVQRTAEVDKLDEALAACRAAAEQASRCLHDCDNAMFRAMQYVGNQPAEDERAKTVYDDLERQWRAAKSSFTALSAALAGAAEMGAAK